MIATIAAQELRDNASNGLRILENICGFVSLANFLEIYLSCLELVPKPSQTALGFAGIQRSWVDDANALAARGFVMNPSVPGKIPDGPVLVSLGFLTSLFLIVMLGSAPSVRGAGEDRRLELHLCNHSSEPQIFAAVAAYDPLLRRVVARGWFPQQRGQCRPVLANLRPPIYVFAESQDGARRWQGESGPDFCFSGDRPFTTAVTDCQGDRRRFRAVELQPMQQVQIWAFDDKNKI